jgi:polar amino acid transport system substrate-binding protein
MALGDSGDDDGDQMTRRVAKVLALIAAVGLLSGCVGGIAEPQRTPKLSPPIISKPGVLTAVVDMKYPPFAGAVGNRKAGLDIDVAAVIADQLGLKLELIDGSAAAGAALVQTGTADIVLGGLTVEQAVGSQLAFAGSYVSDGPAVFASAESSITTAALGTKRIAVQKGSMAYWTLLDQYGSEPLVEYPTLAQAFDAVEAGTADAVGADALVGAYMLRDRPKMAFIAQIGTASPLGVGVSVTRPKLESEVRAILDRLAAEGVLSTLRRKWVGDLPPLELAAGSEESSSTPSGDTSSSAGTSAP